MRRGGGALGCRMGQDGVPALGCRRTGVWAGKVLRKVTSQGDLVMNP